MLDPKVYHFPFIRPSIPPVEEWVGYLEQAYRAKWFSNFGTVVWRLETELTRGMYHPDEVIITASNCTAGISAAANPVLIRARSRVAVYSRVLFFKISDVA